MDPLSSLVVGHAAGKLLDKFGSGFRTHVIERLSRRRAEEFFARFCDEVARQREGASSEVLDQLLSKLMEDEVCSEVFFDAYRRVAFSKSRVLGPRVIALLTAELVIQGRVASDSEEAMLSAAENLSDEELLAFATFIREEWAKSVSESDGKELKIKWCEEQLSPGSRFRETGVSIGPLDFGECLGKWADKMKSFGILKEDMKECEVEYKGRHTDELATVREITWWIRVPSEYLKLVDLIQRASGDVEFGA